MKGVKEEIGKHGLISLRGGEVDWKQVLSEEMQKQTGKLLVTGKLSPGQSTGIAS